jgi:hypothetical protein
MAWATVTCVYAINPTGQLTAAALALAMDAGNVPVNPDYMAMLGATITSDVSAVAGAQAVRTIVFNVSSAQFNAQFPVSAIGPFFGLMVGPIQSFVNCTVVEALPVAA